jgi:serine protease AprX
VSLRAPGSYLDTHYPERITLAHNGSTYFRLSGTSMATAVTTGAAGLLLQNRPKLSPANVKSILANTTQRYGWAAVGIPRPDPAAAGRGLVDALAAAYSGAPAPANAGLRPADMLARSLYSILYGSPLTWKNQSYQGIDWTRLSWGNLAWDNLAWDNLAWDNLAWDNLAWDNLAWDNLAWDNLAWDNLAWDNLAWDAKLD